MSFKDRAEFKETEIGRIPKDWEVRALREVCERIIDCSHAKKPIFQEEGNRMFIEVNNIGDDGYLDLSDVKFVSEKDFFAWTRRLTPQHKDIVITKTGRTGAVSMIPEGITCCIGRNIIRWQTG